MDALAGRIASSSQTPADEKPASVGLSSVRRVRMIVRTPSSSESTAAESQNLLPRSRDLVTIDSYGEENEENEENEEMGDSPTVLLSAPLRSVVFS